MSDGFDPYHKWLAIPPEEQPANHYRLLGVRLFEEDPDVIETSADRQMGHVRRFATGQRGELSQKILNEISTAKVCLLNPAKRAAYDATLKAQQQATALPTAQVLPTAQALPQAARVANPQLRTREDQAVHAGMDIPIMSDSGPSGSMTRRKKKSSPIVAVVALLAGAAAVIGIAAVVLKKPEPSVAVAPDKKPNPPVPPGPSPKIRPAVIPDRPELNTPTEKTDTDQVLQANQVSSEGASPKFTPGKPYNLFTDFNLQENIVAGEGWQFENNVLTIPAGDKARVQSAVPLPEEYMLALTVQRLSGTGALHLGLPIEAGEITCDIDNTFRDSSVFASGFFEVEGNDLNGNRDNQRLPLNQPVQVMCVVRSDNVQLNIGGKIVAAWKPDGRELKPSKYWNARAAGRLVLGGYFSSFKVLRLMVLPIEPRKVASSTGSSGTSTGSVEGKPVDLLAGLDVEKAVVAGEGWSLKDGALTTGTPSDPQSLPNARIQFPNQLPKEYTLTLEVERVSGGKDLLLGLPSPAGQMHATFDLGYKQPEGRPFAGFYDLSAKAAQAGENNPPLLPVGKSTRIKCTIRKDGSTLEVDGRQIAFWRPDGRELSESEWWSGPLKNRLIIGANQSVFRITKLELRSLESDNIASTQSGTGSSTSGTQTVYGKPVDLLTGLDLQKAVIVGNSWRLENGVLSIPYMQQNVNVRMQFPNVLPAEYVLSMIVERTTGTTHFLLGLPSNSGFAYCSVDAKQGSELTAGFRDGGRHSDLAEQAGGPFLPLNEPVQVECSIRKDEFALTINGKKVVTWRPDGRQLEEISEWKGPEKGRLILGSTQSGFKVSRLEFKPIETVVIASTGNAGGPDTDAIVSEFGDPILAGDTPASNPNGPLTNNPGSGDSNVLASGPIKKQDPPTAAQQAETLAVVKDLFPEAYAAAKTPSTKLELGKKLLDTARSTREDPVALYVLLTESLHCAAESGNADIAMQSLTMLERAFNLDVIALSVDTFEKILKGARQNEEHQALLRQVRMPIAAAVQADRYDEAARLLRTAQASARALKDANILKEVTASSKLLRDAQSTYDKVKASKEKLATDPSDAVANLEWGRYLCVVKNNFAEGLPLLAKGSDAKLQEAAKLDLAQPKTGKEQIALGDKWYALADGASGMEESLLRLRAEYWYRKGVSDITGLEKTRIDKRLKDIAEIDRRNVPRPVGSEAGELDVAGGSQGVSMAGICEYSNTRLNALFTYRTGTRVDGTVLRDYLTGAGVPQNGNIRISLVGRLQLQERTEVQFHLVGGSSNGGVCSLSIDGRNSLTVGDNRNKDVVMRRMLDPGVHAIAVQIDGGEIGSFYLGVINEQTLEKLPVEAQRYSPGFASKTVDIADPDGY